jgi:predicted lipoprotein with Yx(FWY)xxD motif
MGRRSVVRVLAMIAAGVLGVGAAWAVTAPIIKSSKNASLGSIVVDAKGLTLYHASSEKNGKITCTGNCVYFWFPVIWKGKGKPVLGKGLSPAKIGTVKRPNGALQVTYNKLPLYRYYLDRKPGQTKGQGVKDPAGTWYAIAASGKVVTKKPGGSGGGGSTGETTTTVGIGY